MELKHAEDSAFRPYSSKEQSFKEQPFWKGWSDKVNVAVQFLISDRHIIEILRNYNEVAKRLPSISSLRISESFMNKTIFAKDFSSIASFFKNLGKTSTAIEKPTKIQSPESFLLMPGPDVESEANKRDLERLSNVIFNNRLDPSIQSADKVINVVEKALHSLADGLSSVHFVVDNSWCSDSPILPKRPDVELVILLRNLAAAVRQILKIWQSNANIYAYERYHKILSPYSNDMFPDKCFDAITKYELCHQGILYLRLILKIWTIGASVIFLFNYFFKDKVAFFNNPLYRFLANLFSLFLKLTFQMAKKWLRTQEKFYKQNALKYGSGYVQIQIAWLKRTFLQQSREPFFDMYFNVLNKSSVSPDPRRSLKTPALTVIEERTDAFQ